jgi:succinate-semialdehyde dehydrogenase/glutarate-semialdehyde dehydrogenase
MTDLTLRDPGLLTNRALIAGEWRGAADGKTLEVTDPFDGSLVGKVPVLGADAAHEAIEAAARAQPAWARKTAKERANVLRRWYELILENLDDLALILTCEQGKPLSEARTEIRSNAPPIWNGSGKRPSELTVISSPPQRPVSASWC